ncbi:MAG: EAL domain-containing protein [Elusimicrobiota bacterium]|nr:EAL domain-containing protein [Elusimicrobiota bacterium]
MKNKHLFSSTSIFYVVLIGILFIIGGSIFYWNSLRSLLRTDVRAFVYDIATQEADNLNHQIREETQILNAMAQTLGVFYKFRPNDQNRLLSLLDMANQRNEFKQMGVILEGNLAIMNDGTLRQDFLNINITRDVMAGNVRISETIFDPFDNQPIIVIAVPIFAADKVMGVLFGTQSTEYYENILKPYKLAGQGFSYVIRSNGDIVIDSKNPAKIQNISNITEAGREAEFDKGSSFANMLANTSKGERGTLSYTIFDEHRFLNYLPLNINDWYLVFVVPTQVVRERSTKILFFSLALFLAMIVLFGGIFTYLMIRRRNDKDSLFYLAYKDGVTGIWNLNKFRQDLPHILQHNPHKQYVVVVMDINKFKVINDLFGHKQGDIVLMHLADCIKRNLHHDEPYARLALDVFAFMMEYKNDEIILQRLKAMKEEISNCYALSGANYKIVPSFGIYRIKEKIPFYLMIDRANIARKVAKASGGKTYTFYEESSRKLILQEKAIENNMEAALQDHQFAVYFQPQYYFKDAKLSSCEALIRWAHPRRGLVMPDEFIPVFEKNGFIMRLDMFILEEVAKKIRLWLDEGLTVLPIAVNFSKTHLNNSNYVKDFKIIIDKYQIPPKLIEVEITESAAFSDIEKIKKFIDDMHALGFAVAMDDFGSGFSSLNMLKELPFDTIKLDKEFLKDSDGNLRAHNVITGAVKMLKSLNIKVIAEGVETPEQAEFLKQAGVDIAQGYLYSKPLSADIFEAMIKNAGKKQDK